MLEEVRCAICLVGFRARAGIDPDADGARLGVRGVLGCYLHSRKLISKLIPTITLDFAKPMDTYSKAITQSRALGGTPIAHGSSETADEAWLLGCLRLYALDRASGAEALIESQSETSRSHEGGKERMERICSWLHGALRKLCWEVMFFAKLGSPVPGCSLRCV